VVEPGQELDLAHDLLGQLLVVRVEADPLDGVHLRVQVVLHLDHLAEAALADLADVRKFALGKISLALSIVSLLVPVSKGNQENRINNQNF
jgi:hypothetical protein